MFTYNIVHENVNVHRQWTNYIGEQFIISLIIGVLLLNLSHNLSTFLYKKRDNS